MSRRQATSGQTTPARRGLGERRRSTWLVPLLLAATTLWTIPARAQSDARFGVETVVAVDAFRGDNVLHRPNIIADVTGTVRLTDRWRLYIRPWFRQPRTDEWDAEIYEAALRYQRPGSIATRVDVGYISSPVGLGMADTRADVNPTILPHLAYFTPLPAFDRGAPRVMPISVTYPLGAQATFSTDMWDARAAVVTSAPTRIFAIGNTPHPPATPFLAVGGGVTPMAGMRFGLSFGAGEYVSREELSSAGGGASGGRSLAQFGVEGEYAFRYLKISGELVRDSFETSAGHAIAYEWFLQGTQTLTPRWFIAGRTERSSAPGLQVSATSTPQTFRTAEGTVGFRLSPELTLRGSIAGRKAFSREDWDRQAGASVVWSRRWW